jgi:hypothetical protein
MIDQNIFWMIIFFGIMLCMLSIWVGWTWIGTDGHMLRKDLRPGFFKFWFSITPRFLLGLRTGMEEITLLSE